jgi:hypothetical protein
MARVKLAKVSVEELKKEIRRRQGKLATLIAARDALNCRIAELEALCGAKPTAVARKKAGRRKAARRAVKPARAGSLSSTLAEALKAKGKWTVAEAAEAALAAGYRSKSKDFANIVSMALSKDKRFRRVRRGIYALRGK